MHKMTKNITQLVQYPHLYANECIDRLPKSSNSTWTRLQLEGIMCTRLGTNSDGNVVFICSKPPYPGKGMCSAHYREYLNERYQRTKKEGAVKDEVQAKQDNDKNNDNASQCSAQDPENEEKVVENQQQQQPTLPVQSVVVSPVSVVHPDYERERIVQSAFTNMVSRNEMSFLRQQLYEAHAQNVALLQRCGLAEHRCAEAEQRCLAAEERLRLVVEAVNAKAYVVPIQQQQQQYPQPGSHFSSTPQQYQSSAFSSSDHHQPQQYNYFSGAVAPLTWK